MQDSVSSVPRLSKRKGIALLIIGVFALTFSVYWQSLGNQFVSWNDPTLIYGNEIVTHPSFDAVKQAFTRYDPELYIPLTFLSYQADYLIGGINPFIYRLDNLLIHTFNVLLVIWLLYLLSENLWVAVIAGLLFAVHPMNTEAVAWSSARKDLLSTLFFLSSFIAYLYYKPKQKRWLYALSVALFLLGLLSKVIVMTLPLVLLLVDTVQQGRWRNELLRNKIPYFVLSIIFLIVAWFGKSQAILNSGISEKFLIACKSIAFYIEKLIVPYHLSILYPYNTDVQLASADMLFSFGVILLLVLAIQQSWKKYRLLAFGLIFFVITIVPTLTNIYRNQDLSFAADHYAYLPSVGFFFAAALAAYWLGKHVRPTKIALRAGTVICAYIILMFAYFAHAQATVWHDSTTLFSNALQYYPETLSARMNLLDLYLQSGDTREAMQQAQQLLALQPRGRTHRLIGDIYLQEHLYAQAEAEYKTASNMEPTSAEHYIRLGDLYAIEGKLTDAEREYKTALSYDAAQIDVYDNLATVYLAEKKYTDAEATARTMLSHQVLSSRGHYLLGLALEHQNRMQEAVVEYKESVALDNTNVDALASLSAGYLQLGKNALALDALKKAYAIDPSNQAVQVVARTILQMGIARMGSSSVK